MASIRRTIQVAASPALVWDAVRDVGALHTRLVPGFVVDTRLEPGLRVVTFASGRVLRERIVACDDAGRRLVWAIEDPWLSHHNGALEVAETPAGTACVTWTADLLPDDRAGQVAALMEQGLAIMAATLAATLGGRRPGWTAPAVRHDAVSIQQPGEKPMSEERSVPHCAQKAPYPVEVEAGRTYSWCACGLSAKQPFCDGSHKTTDMVSLKWTAETSGRVWFCGCKATGKAPLCDGKHKAL